MLGAHKLEQNDLFCPKCGIKISEQSQMPDFDYDTNNEANNKAADAQDIDFVYASPAIKAVPDVKTKKKAKGKLAAAVIAALLLLTSGILVFANPFTKSGMNPKDDPDAYLQNVFRKSINESKKEYLEAYSNLTGSSKEKDKDAAYDVNVDVTLGTFLSSMLSSSGININSFALDFSYIKQGDNTSSIAGIMLNNENIISAQALYDILTDEGYLSIPELSPAYMKFSVQDVISEIFTDELNTYGTDLYNFSQYTNIYNEYLTNLPKEGDIDKSVDIISDVILSTLITDIGYTEDVTVAVDDLSVKYNRFTVDLTSRKALDFVDGLLTAIDNDDYLKSIVSDLLQEAQISISDLSAEIDSSRKELQDKGMLDDKACTITYYINNKDEIKGIELSVTEDSDIVIGYKEAAEGSKNRSVFNVTEDGQELVSLYNRYNKNNDKLNGELTFAYSEYDDFFNEYIVTELKAAYSDLEYNHDKKVLKGSIVLSASLPELQGASLSLVFDCDKESSNVTIDASYLAQKLISIKVSYQENNSRDITGIDSSQKIYDITSDTYALDNYLSDVDLEAFLNDVINKLGISLDSLYY